MGTILPLTKIVQDAPLSGYAYVGSQIAELIERFNLHASRSQIMQTYEDICRDSLAFSRDTRPPNHSRINHDGTPLQYAVTIGSSHQTLQFLSEAGSPGIMGAERMRVNRDCFTTVAQRLHAHKSLSTAIPLLNAMAPETDIDLLADPGGAYWIGVAFTVMQKPHLRVYINARWGKEQDRWKRLSQFASHFDQSIQWRDIATPLKPDMHPLGTAITFNGDKFPSGRIYLSAYGKRMPFYEELAKKYGGADFMHQLRTFGKYMLDDDYVYPTQTAVCSFGFDGDSKLNFKFELCAHCLFSSDVEASTRLRSWFEIANLHAADYWDVLDLLSEGNLSDKDLDLHCYVGVGLRRGAPYTTIYLKPRLIAA